MTMTATTHEAPRAWVGCLGCYNDGDLVGRWLDDPDEIRSYTCPRPKTVYNFHEELWVFDHENAPWLTGECSPMDFADKAEKYTAALDELDDIPADALAAWIDNRGADYVDWDTLADDVRESYAGEWDDLGAFAWSFHHDTDSDEVAKWRDEGPYRYYIDWDAIGRDLRLGGDVWTHEKGSTVYVFWSNR